MSGELVGLPESRHVRVQRAGNSKMLPIPAEVSREVGAELGEAFVLTVLGQDLLYRREVPGVGLHGSGAGLVGVLSADDVIAAPGRNTVPPLADWDF